MSGATIIPGANTTAHWFKGKVPSGISQARITKLVLHTTETSPRWGCPGYSGGASAPTVTIDPWNLRMWQHFPANESAKALEDPTSTPVRENRDEVAQIEIICYCDPKLSAQYGFDVRNIPEAGLAYIAKVVRFYHEQWGLPLVAAPVWKSYPELASGRTSVRMSSATYDAFKGVLGHQHVSGNHHLDPGSLNVTRIMQLAKAGSAPAPAPATSSKTWTVSKGQTLTGIAAALGITLAALLSVNTTIKDPNVIQPGQVVTVPPAATMPAPKPASPAPAPTVKPAPAPAPKPVVTKRTRINAAKLHRGSRSRAVTAYQRALRAYLGKYANRYNPSGVTGFYGSQTALMTQRVYRDLARKHPRAGWTPGATEPGPGLLKVLGLR